MYKNFLPSPQTKIFTSWVKFTQGWGIIKPQNSFKGARGVVKKEVKHDTYTYIIKLFSNNVYEMIIHRKSIKLLILNKSLSFKAKYKLD